MALLSFVKLMIVLMVVNFIKVDSSHEMALEEARAQDAAMMEQRAAIREQLREMPVDPEVLEAREAVEDLRGQLEKQIEELEALPQRADAE